MLIVAVMGLAFNLIQMKILHSGDGHYHLGGSHDHDHDHDHDHGHGHSHKHSHSPKKEQAKSHKHDHGVTNPELKEPLIDQEEHKHDHDHDHDHEHNHDHDHKHKNHDHDHEHKHDREADKCNHNHDEAPKRNINITSAYLHVLGDMLMSVGVIIAAVVIYFKPEWMIVDPICTYLFSVIVCFTTVPVFKECIFVLLEGTPSSINIE